MLGKIESVTYRSDRKVIGDSKLPFRINIIDVNKLNNCYF